LRIVVTAGPTREYLDPVRFLSNPSTGKMGFAVAAEAARRGHDVTLIAGPVALKTPEGVKRIDVVSARDMLKAVGKSISHATGMSRPRRCVASQWGRGTLAACQEGACHNPVAFISTAAVADWRPARCAASKLKKHQMSGTLKLVRNPDILKKIGQGRRPRSTKDVNYSSLGLRLRPSPLFLVGFAAETDNVLAEASRKCREKGLSFIVANDVTEKGSGFGTDTNRVTFVFPDGTLKRHPLMTKRRVASAIIREIEGLSK